MLFLLLPLKPMCCLDVPVIQEYLKAGGKLKNIRVNLTDYDTSDSFRVGGGTNLYIHDPEVGNEIPSRQTITVVAIKAKSCCVIDGISYLEKQYECQDTLISNIINVMTPKIVCLSLYIVL